MRGLWPRVLTAAVLIPLAVLIVVLGGRIYSAVIAFMAILLIFEWTRMVDGAEFSRGFYTLSLTAIVTVFVAASGLYGWAILSALVGGGLATLMEARRGPSVPWALAGAVYLVIPAIAALYVRHGPEEGLILTILLFFTVWATDSGAYLAGCYIGGPKLWPSLSPRKTWAGALGGALSGLITALVLGLLLRLPVPMGALVALGLILPFAAIIGDLLESALKRVFGVKDTGAAFPGHGGVLDRLDGFIVAAVALALLVLFGQYAGL